MPLPRLPSKAAYIHLSNPSRRNALSLAVLRDLRAQLHKHLTSPQTGRLLTLPPFQPSLLPKLEEAAAAAADGSEAHPELQWLVSGAAWRRERGGLPAALVLRSEGPVFSAGHDLRELAALPRGGAREAFALCAEVMGLVRRSPAPVVCAVQGLATAAGLQLALACDYPVALASTAFQLPGVGIGLPCTSPVTAVSRRLGAGVAYRMLLTGEPVTAGELGGGGAVDVVPVPEHAEASDTAAAAFEARVASVVKRLAQDTAGQPQALGKWAYWTQLGIRGDGEGGGGGDGYEDAVQWAGRVMALHARSSDANEGITAFLEKRKPEWKT